MTFIVSTDCCAPEKLFFECEHTLVPAEKKGSRHAVATSIDALAVGITFAFLDYPIVEAITIIGISTFFISIGGVYVGNFFGNKYEKKAEFAGGLILVLLGVRILLTHLGIL